MADQRATPDRIASHGRGGAGTFTTQSTSPTVPQPTSLHPPSVSSPSAPSLHRPPPSPSTALTSPPHVGNIGKDDPAAHTTPKDLVTPTLKSEHYTTGRGGSGNMAKNDPARPEIARAAQDVEAPAHREQDGPHHYGRGGAANIAVVSEEERRRGAGEKEREKEGGNGNGNMNGSGNGSGGRKSGEEGAARERGFVDKGKELLQKLGGKK